VSMGHRSPMIRRQARSGFKVLVRQRGVIDQ
jgi:hypothetical protein